MNTSNLLRLGLFYVCCFLAAYATAQKSVTVFTHGFQGRGSGEDLTDFYTFVRGIKTRAGANTAIYTNDVTMSGGWFKLSDLPNYGRPSDCQITDPATANIILLYDWRSLSNDMAAGSLEAAADQLFGILAHPHGLVYGNNTPMNVNFLTNPAVHKHFISHSRGNVLMMQVLRRINKYFPNTQIDHWTTLDPHPAEGDLINDTHLWGIEPDVNYNYKLRLPASEAHIPIVKKVDNYFRRASTYQPLSGNYSGVFVEGTSDNFELNETDLSTGCYSTRAHSNVHAWYYGTITTSALMTYGDCNNEYFPLTWYPSGWRLSHGYNKSFLGGGYNANNFNTVTGTRTSTLDAGKPTLESVFNGSFQSGNVGWDKSSNYTSVSDGYLKLAAQQKMVHNKLYFPSNRKYLQLKAKSLLPNWILNIVFSEYNNNVLRTEKTIVHDGAWQTLYIPIPASLLGKVGNFKIETQEGNDLDQLHVDDLELVDCPPNCDCDVPPITPVTNPEYGVTLLVHGFSGSGDIDASWTAYANGIADRATNATIYKNDATTGVWYPIGARGNGNGEIILVYDWADLSNNLGTGFLQSAADYLYASLVNPPTAHSRLKGTHLLGKKLHFIGHSRGTILLLQVLHRMLANHGTDVKVNQLTLLDPHPATTFGDVETEQNIYKSLPGVTGIATGCSLTLGCSDGSNVSLKIPNNVEHADHYYRTDPLFEGATDWGSFNGVSVAGLGNYSRKLSNPILNTPMCMTGLADGQSHSKVHAWYYGTVKPVGTVSYNDCTINDQTPANWYDCLVYENLGNLPSARTRTGFYHSRLGGGALPPAPTVTTNLVEMNNALTARGEANVIKPVFNGDFKYGAAGWERNNRSNNVTYNLTFPYFANGHALLGIDINGNTTVPQTSITHSLLFFGKEMGTNKDYRYVRMSIKDASSSGTSQVKVSFMDCFGTVQSSEQIEVTGSNGILPSYFAIPTILRGKTGTFKIENIAGTSIEIDDVDLAPCKPGCDCAEAPTAPINFAANSTVNGVVLSWEDNSNTSNYVIEQSIGSPSNWSVMTTLSNASRTFAAGKLASNTSAHYRIKAVNGCVFSAYRYSEPIVHYSYLVHKQVAQLEYFIDTDPGFGNGTSVAISAGRTVALDFIASLTDISAGIHTFYLRAKDNENHWSNVYNQIFLKTIGKGGSLRIEQVEYFFDEDPGFGNGTSVTLTEGQIIVLSFAADAAGLSPGVHVMHIRAKDSGGNWSNVHNQVFLKTMGKGGNPQLEQVEYFFDEDPGVGNGTSVMLTAGRIIDFSFIANAAGLSAGVHVMHIRAKDSGGNWSNLYTQVFLKAMGKGGTLQIEQVEYFFDEDPGFGNGTSVTLTEGQIIVLSFAADAAGLSPGVHVMHIRAKDSGGNWSNVHNQVFLKTMGKGGNPQLEQVEYFFDEDPGVGNGTSVMLTAGRIIDFSFIANAAGLSAGVHVMHIRAKDSGGNWSNLYTQVFLKAMGKGGTLQIEQVEYFFDKDPGFGNGTSVTLTEGQTIDLSFAANTTGLSAGVHVVHIRAKDNGGNWSNVHAQAFIKTVGVGDILRLEKIEYFLDEDPGLGLGTDVSLGNIGNFSLSQTNFVVNLNNVREGVHMLYVRAKDSGGKWSTVFSRPFICLQGIGGNTEISRLEYFIDTDPGLDLGIEVPITAAASLDKQFSVDLSAVSNGVHTLYVRTKDNKGKWSSIFISPFVKLVGAGGQPVITQIEYYFDTDPGLGNGTTVTITPVASANITSNISLAHLSNGRHTLYIRGKDGNQRWSHIFQDTVHVNPTWILPVELSEFTVQLVKKEGLLKWSTQSEKNTRLFEIERSIDATHFNKIGEVKSLGNSSTVKNYSFTDNFLESNKVHYYRLKIVDLDGSSTYSEIKSLYLVEKKKFSATIFPNPNDGLFSIILNGSIDTQLPVQVSVIDLQGKVIMTMNNISILSDNLFHVDLKDIASGAYYLVIKNGAQLISQSVVKY
jgi:Secretion system C-terminal sorting domain